MSPGGLRYEEPDYTYPTTEEAWTKDWENIGHDFRLAAEHLRKECLV